MSTRHRLTQSRALQIQAHAAIDIAEHIEQSPNPCGNGTPFGQVNGEVDIVYTAHRGLDQEHRHRERELALIGRFLGVTLHSPS